jgi:protein TonB
MFDTVLEKGSTQKSRFGTGTVISILVHAGVLGVAWWMSTQAPAPLQADEPVVFLVPTPPPPPPPPPARSSARRPDPKPHTKPTLKPPTAIPQTPPEAAEPVDEPVEGGVEGGEEGGVEGGMFGGVADGVLKGVLNSSGTDVLDFGKGMTRPEPQNREACRPQYTREALANRVEGLMIVKCVIDTDGTTENCRVIKPLPHMEQEVLDAVRRCRYSPVTYQGRPVKVDYVFNIRLQMP